MRLQASFDGTPLPAKLRTTGTASIGLVERRGGIRDGIDYIDWWMRVVDPPDSVLSIQLVEGPPEEPARVLYTLPDRNVKDQDPGPDYGSGVALDYYGPEPVGTLYRILARERNHLAMHFRGDEAPRRFSLRTVEVVDWHDIYCD